MRVQRKPGLIIVRVFGSEMVQQQKWIKIVESARSDTSLEPHPRSLDYWLRLDDAFDSSLHLTHASPLFCERADPCPILFTCIFRGCPGLPSQRRRRGLEVGGPPARATPLRLHPPEASHSSISSFRL